MNEEKIRKVVSLQTEFLHDVKNVADKASLRGIEGNSASEYFQAFDEMILQDKDAFHFCERTRRPPLD